MTADLTAIVLCRDSERDLPGCLDSLEFADAVLVVDSGSRDRSREIAAGRGARVLERPLDRFDAQRNWAQAQATTPWVLFVDSDEVVPPALAREIRGALERPVEGGPAAWSIPRRNHFLGRHIRRCGWGRDRVIRLLRRDAVRWEGAVHEKPRVTGKVEPLRAALEHNPYPTLSAYWDKLERYARLQALRDHERGRRAGAVQLLWRPKLMFLRMYFMRAGFLEGTHGLVLCLMSAFSAFTRAVRLWEMGLPAGVARPPHGPKAKAPGRGGPPVSVLIPTFNEEDNIEGALASAGWADEVLVVDSFSTDRTVEMARPLATCVLEHEYVNSAAQKNWSLPRLQHRWAMVLDADERFTPELAAEVRDVLASGPPASAYWIRRVNHFLGKRIRFCGWSNDRVIRLFDRERSRYQELEVHAEIEVDGPVSEMRHPLLHFTYTSVDQYWPKFRRYTDWGASQAFTDGRRATLYHLVGHPLGRFLKMYLLRLGILDGTHGVAISALSFFSVFNKYAKLWEMRLPAREAAGTGRRAAGGRRGAGAAEGGG